MSEKYRKQTTISAGVRQLEAPPNTSVRPPTGGLRAKPPAGSRSRAPGLDPEAETLLAFGRSLKVANLPTFKKFETQKNQIHFVLSLQKMTSIGCNTSQITVQ